MKRLSICDMKKKKKEISPSSAAEMKYERRVTKEEVLEEKAARLERCNSILRAAIESAPDGLLVTDESGQVHYSNRLYREMWAIPDKLEGTEEHRSLIQHCSRFMSDPEKFVLSTESIYTTWPAESFDVLEFADGRIFERFTKADAAENQNLGRVWSFRDVTARRQADAYKAQLAAIVESSNDAIVVKDLNGIITAWNTASERTFGYRASEIIGCSITKLIPPDRLEEEERIMRLIRKGKVTGHFETVRWAKDRRPIDVSVTISPVKDPAGRIIGASKIARDITQYKESQQRIEYLAHYDALTGLPNRALLTDRMNIALANADRYSRRLGLLFLDLDRFKLVNDSLGHETGDRLLKLVAERMQSVVRRADTVSRRGGDEFIVLLSQLETFDDARRVSEDIIAALSQPYMIDQHELVLTTSIGISIYPDHGRDADTLLRNADMAMYAAKESGRSRYQFYAYDSASGAMDGLEPESDWRGALERDEIHLVYQPRIALATGRVTGMEAFVRWQHPERKRATPVNLIPVENDSGLIQPLGAWMLHEACVFARKLRKRGFDIDVSLDIPALQFRQDDFVGMVVNALRETGLSPQHLELELIESEMMQQVDSTLRKMRSLDGLGIKVAIDGFGTGYSSLSYLQQSLVDRLKINRTFILDLPNNEGARTIVSAIVAMGRSLGLCVTADGVETKAQESFLRDVGCDDIQGYLYARPMPARDLEAWLAARQGQDPVAAAD